MFELVWSDGATEAYERLRSAAAASVASRNRAGKKKSSKAEGLFKQANKTLNLLASNPKHPGLNTHAYSSLAHPYQPDGKVFEAYVQNQTPGAFRIFWCYGPEKKQITVIAITPHP